ncbi:hypothetical protein [Vibrio fluvialis]|nr:hypothetical protein [Vibrio fluvialis]MBL4293634.1 hypothetical protein [Vibrio fluvialis]
MNKEERRKGQGEEGKRGEEEEGGGEGRNILSAPLNYVWFDVLLLR